MRPHLQAVVAQILSQFQGALAHGTYKGQQFSACLGYLLQADRRSNKILHKRAGVCVAVVLFNYL